MKNNARALALFLAVLPTLLLTAQDTSSKSASSDLSSDEKITILAKQIELRDTKISDLNKELTKLNKKLDKKTSSDNKNTAPSKELQSALEELELLKTEKTTLGEKVASLESQLADSMKQSEETPTSTEATNEINDLTEKLSIAEKAVTQKTGEVQNLEERNKTLETEMSELKSKGVSASSVQALSEKQIDAYKSEINELQIQIQNLNVQLNDKQLKILSLQEELNASQQQLIARRLSDTSSKGKKSNKRKKVNDLEEEVVTTPIKGKNYFYITASTNLDVDNNYGIEIGSIKNFNKRSAKPVKLGLDVAYLSANIRNADLDDVDALLEEPVGAIGVKIGPNIGIRLVKGIHVNLNYRYFPAADLSVQNDETSIDYKGFHTAGASVKIGLLTARAEWDITNIVEEEGMFDQSPLSIYLGLMF